MASILLRLLLFLAVCYAAPKETKDIDKTPHHRLVNFLKLSQSEEGLGSRIVGGKNATRGQFPFISLLYVAFEDSRGQCGASLVSPSFLLTAAHCIYKADWAIVAVGVLLEQDLGEDDTYVAEVLEEDLLPHPQYNENEILNDIGLIRLAEPVPRMQATPILLPTFAHRSVDAFAGLTATIAGWGRTSDGKRTSSPELRYAEVRVTRLSECRRFYQPAYIINSHQVCTSFNGSGTCNGDSGGPLIVRLGGKQVLVGVTSFGTKLCEQAAPNVFTNVASFLPWLMSHLSPKTRPAKLCASSQKSPARIIPADN